MSEENGEIVNDPVLHYTEVCWECDLGIAMASIKMGEQILTGMVVSGVLKDELAITVATAADVVGAAH